MKTNEEEKKKENTAENQNSVKEEAPKKKRGRPRKVKTEEEIAAEEAPKRKRGRPRKVKTEEEIAAEAAAPKKKRGRPRKTLLVEVEIDPVEADIDLDDVKPEVVVIKSADKEVVAEPKPKKATKSAKKVDAVETAGEESPSPVKMIKRVKKAATDTASEPEFSDEPQVSDEPEITEEPEVNEEPEIAMLPVAEGVEDLVQSSLKRNPRRKPSMTYVPNSGLVREQRMGKAGPANSKKVEGFAVQQDSFVRSSGSGISGGSGSSGSDLDTEVIAGEMQSGLTEYKESPELYEEGDEVFGEEYITVDPDMAHSFESTDDIDIESLEKESEETSEPEHNGVPVEGIFDLADYQSPSYGFLRREGVSSENDIYVSPMFIRKFNLRPGEKVTGFCRKDSGGERYRALLYVSEVNGIPPYVPRSKYKFDEMIPLFPRKRFLLSGDSSDKAMRILDLIAPIGKGQRGLIVAPPKSGKTILLQKIAKSIKDNYPDVELMILLIDERPEEVTDMKEYVDAPVYYSTFDELPSNHIKIAELVLSRARGLVEMGKDVVILLDSITRLARAYNIALPSTGRTLSGGLDTGALHKPKRFLGSARNTKEGGSLTILATALVETGSKMDDVIFEEFKGTGNMELILDRKLSEKRIFPSIDIKRSGTRREELILTPEEYEAVLKIRRTLDRMGANDPVEKLLVDIVNTKNNDELISLINKKL